MTDDKASLATVPGAPLRLHAPSGDLTLRRVRALLHLKVTLSPGVMTEYSDQDWAFTGVAATASVAEPTEVSGGTLTLW